MKRGSFVRSMTVAVVLVAALAACVPISDVTPDRTPSRSASTPSPTADATPGTTPDPDVTASVQPEPTADGPIAVTIVNWGADGKDVYASGIVTGATGGGTCTLTATSSDGRVLRGSRDAESTPAAVNCGQVRIPAPSGQWSLVLGFHSATADASSAPAVTRQP